MSDETFAIVTFGCKVNQYEAQGIREDLVRRGCREVGPADSPSLYIVNSCTVTEAASREAQSLTRRLRRRNPRARIVFTGCAAETDRAALETLAEVVGQREKARLGETLFPRGGNGAPSRDLPVSRFDGHTRAFLKVEDGCDLRCSFCILPQVRGGVVSRPLEEAAEEARRLVDGGHREIVLTGVHLGSYGRDLAGRSLVPDLVERLLDIPGLGRVRLSSIEANEISDPLLDLMAAEPRRLCPHLHLPMQSGDDAILRAMRRRYNARGFLEACRRAAERVPDPAFTTDVIVGFPGETAEQFENTVDTCRRAGMSRIHIFPYSPRRGTDAVRMRDDVPGPEKKRRLRRLREVSRGLASSFAEKFVGREVDVLVERSDGSGYTERYLKARVAGGRPGSLAAGRGARVGADRVLEVES